ncbi:transcriptional regulator domain-containing protein (plasmid) [Gemmatirosa kalamazoonensis]|uniref:Transcriptional regulator domain-containing protein n=1 Tax=Gemmatirosa kalamazoonensis TaxID=861299 RepID=W0RS93_9BACT|nr:response regulator transcription factor [Gemmatirosa kalamazoonensis]AHG93327.1 transcriptional regulator domain-containing protein [Gemmatirosa kalamazoonensis]
MADILIVEDDADIASGLRENLELEGHAVRIAPAGTMALALARDRRPDLVILDLSLPDMDGHELLRRFRMQGYTSAVVILSARDAQAEKIVGLRLGADDYVTKPFGVLELLARIDAVLRRTGTETARSAAPPAEHGPTRDVERVRDVEVDRDARVVRVAGQHVALSPKEFDLLDALLRRQGRLATRRELLREVWGYSTLVSSRTVDTHVAQLRRKLERDPVQPELILTVAKSGYRLNM